MVGNKSLLNVGGQGNDMIESMLQAVGSGGMWRMKGRLENQQELGSLMKNILHHPGCIHICKAGHAK